MGSERAAHSSHVILNEQLVSSPQVSCSGSVGHKGQKHVHEATGLQDLEAMLLHPPAPQLYHLCVSHLWEMPYLSSLSPC